MNFLNKYSDNLLFPSFGGARGIFFSLGGVREGIL